MVNYYDIPRNGSVENNVSVMNTKITVRVVLLLPWYLRHAEEKRNVKNDSRMFNQEYFNLKTFSFLCRNTNFIIPINIIVPIN